jgi:hypothetical protein
MGQTRLGERKKKRQERKEIWPDEMKSSSMTKEARDRDTRAYRLSLFSACLGFVVQQMMATNIFIFVIFDIFPMLNARGIIDILFLFSQTGKKCTGVKTKFKEIKGKRATKSCCA